MADPRQRRLAIALLVVVAWVGITLPGVGLALVINLGGDLACEAEVGDSNYGELEWSVAPPGPRCVWTRKSNGFAATDGPSPIWSLWLFTVVALGLVGSRQTVVARAPAKVPSGSDANNR